ncbi:MAG: Cobalamin (Vitamin B12) biosynthesis CbiX protein [Methanomicrobiales archaeon 53_19]|uniref:sirohydrochlorin nickelochelatase n=1 Tax=Methanocalculus sp. TaxID=2004547 RepID=UPI0007468ADC|nr:sirohydrochlorin nickelochelatase [Methanocalculus sp.]KUK67948.1 MAG: Cobalamin (Vitamin B12) biosynthesis CbiX protein [Methanocalculus sp. 52_23]KUL03617.1 MAG: Cobalamin (Vitamin B12) biosynthesis CbiX protein [Methanomicrobiales archaeon 53_19]HIJ06250.1 sirohydrochlorin nickelochelatase [Methanocalculus sp.]
MAKKGLLLVGHGSKLQHNKELVDNTAALIAEKNNDYIVKSGFMSMNEPSVQDSIQAFSEEDVDLLVVVPLFLAKGIHILKDIPGILGLEEGKKRGVVTLNGKEIPLVYADPIGGDPLLAELMLKNAENAIRDHL